MKFCSKCGAQLGEGSRWCGSCGAPCEDAGVQRRVYQEAPGQARKPDTPAGTVLTMGASPIFMAAVLCYTGMIVFSFLNSISNTPGAYVEELLNSLGIYNYYYYELYSYMRVLDNISIAGTLISLAPQVVFSIGMWLVLMACRNAAVKSVSTAGFTTIRVMLILQVIFISVIFGIVELLLLVTTGEMADSYYVSEGAIFIMILVIAALAGVFVLAMMFYSKVLRLLRELKDAVEQNTPVNSVSIYVVIVNFIGAFFGLFSLFSGFLGFLSAGMNIAFLIIISVAMLNLQKEMMRFRQGPQ